MGRSRARVAALAAKELAELRATPSVLGGPLLMLATAVVVPFAVAIGVPWWSGEALADAEDLVTMARESLRGAATLGAEGAGQALLLARFLPLLVLVPVIGAMSLVTTSIVDELRGRSLEPLLATPITTFELLVAKAGSAFVVAIALLAAGAGLAAVAALVLAEPGVVTALVSTESAALVLGLAPAVAAAAVMLGVVASSRAKDARAAQQFSLVIVVPLIGLFVGQIAEGVTSPTLLACAAAAWTAAVGFALAGVRVFDRERILTRWTQ
jgi:ABC-2 type transport system permease protein